MSLKRFFVLVIPLFCIATTHLAAEESNAGDERIVTLLFTNDVESAYDPIQAYWLDDIDMIGGIAEMTTLIDELRVTEPNVFLFDSGDIFTGALAKLTEGRLAFELMITMGYDAMAIGNHEFEYGVEILEWQKNRVPFPVLGANLFYKNTYHPYAQAHAIIERGGIRIGVIGIMGQDAATAIIPSYIEPLDVIEPAIAVRKSVMELRDQVDLIVLLTHQGKTAPMQTDAESDPRLNRGVAVEIELAAAVPGIDVLFSGHADAGTVEPVVEPTNGTLIMQTHGQATHLGYLKVAIGEDGKITQYDGKLIPVEASKLEPDPRVVAKLEQYRRKHVGIFSIVGETEAPMIRRYIEESDLGNLFADIFVDASGADMAFVHAGSLRKDLPEGEILLVDILDSYPFVDAVDVKEMSGSRIRRVLEQSLTLERGLLQVSAGIEMTYDLSRPEYQRIVTLKLNGRPIVDNETYTVAASGFLAEGGDLYDAFPESEVIESFGKVSDVIIAYFRDRESVATPRRGRQWPVAD